MDPVVVYVALFVVSFLLGSIPFGLIISKVFYHTDIREHGSGNIGTTNAIRTMGKVGGYSVFVLAKAFSRAFWLSLPLII